jgi:hypothetical protein
MPNQPHKRSQNQGGKNPENLGFAVLTMVETVILENKRVHAVDKYHNDDESDDAGRQAAAAAANAVDAVVA